ncbi:hypothetical protein KIW84_050209, partial [Lathyrus oleraceus]
KLKSYTLVFFSKMMSLRSAFALLPLFLFLIVANVESRKDVGEYWKLVMKDQDMPEEIQGLLDASNIKNSKTHAKENMGAIGEFEPRPYASAYGDNEIHAKENMGAIGEFEPRPNASAYGDNEIHANENKGATGEFEPRPNISAYGDNEIHANENKGAIGEFETRPNASAYGDNEIGAEFTDDFEPRPSMTKYNA